MTITPLYFTGISKFSADFQKILKRSVDIASIPLTQMQNEQADLLTKKQLLSDISGTVDTLAGNISSLGSIGENRGLSASSSNTSRVTVTLNGATQPGSYVISDITSVAEASSETTASGYATADSTAVSTDGTLELVVGSNTYTVDLTAAGKNNLNGLRDAINGLGSGVVASVVDTGTGSQPNYLSITATSTGTQTLQLRETAGDASSNILTANNQGANAVFKLDGLDVVSSDNVINDVVPGLTFTIQSITDVGEQVTLTLASSRSGLATALSDLVNSYNGTLTKVEAQVGKTAGLLSGDYIIRDIQNQMRVLASYRSTGSSNVNSLMDLGIGFDTNGQMSFDSSQFNSLSNNDISAAFDFLGSSTTGFGALADNFKQISDPVTGLIKTQQDQYDVADQRLSDQMAALTDRIDYMQSSLLTKLQQADVLLSQLESQQTMLDSNIQSLNLVLYGKSNS